jgi:predicted transcriptional regulator
MTVRTSRDTVDEIDALAEAMHRSRNYVVNEAIEEYIAARKWQIERIPAGIKALEEGRVRPAEDSVCGDRGQARLGPLMQLIITEPAERDLDEIVDYIAADNPVAKESGKGKQP